MWVAISYKEIFPKPIYGVIYHMKTLGSHSRGKYSSAIRISPIIYFLISIGVSLQISGSNWDIVWHGVGNVETFFTPPHSALAAGMLMAALGALMGIFSYHSSRKSINISSSSLFSKLSLIVGFAVFLMVAVGM